ncbi:ATP-binding protein [Ruminococcaceae bacterium BL-4]|nr:ATP-binding protein [Ruminococcaceae bacterium BL-4]
MKLLLPESIGSQRFRQDLEDAFENGRFPHAVLLEGTSDSTLPIAKLLSAACVCTDDTARPCGHCAGCKKALLDCHPDISLLSGEGGARSFHKESITFLRSDAAIRPNEAACKVYILADAQNLSEQAQNALLKTLEEPFSAVQFFLTAENASALLPTIRSRVQTFRLETKISQPDSLSKTLCEKICHGDEFGFLCECAQLFRDKPHTDTIFHDMILLFRDALILRCGGKPLCDMESAKLLSKGLTKAKLFSFVRIAQEEQNALHRNANVPLLLTHFASLIFSGEE